jgi:hypothetical protein
MNYYNDNDPFACKWLKELRLLNRALRENSASYQPEHDKSGIKPILARAIGYYLCSSTGRFFHTQAYGLHQELFALRNIRRLLGHRGYDDKNAQGLCWVIVSLLFFGGKGILVLDFVYAILGLFGTLERVDKRQSKFFSGSDPASVKTVFRIQYTAYRLLLSWVAKKNDVLLRTIGNSIYYHVACIRTLFRSGRKFVFSCRHNTIFSEEKI